MVTRYEPIYKTRQITLQANLAHRPALKSYSRLVRVIPAPPKQAPSDQPLVLGVDAGSTTTKMALIDQVTRRLIASHYTRTNGDPVAAIRECLHALEYEVGNRAITLIGTTGSARELAGAYLRTEHVQRNLCARGRCGAR